MRAALLVLLCACSSTPEPPPAPAEPAGPEPLPASAIAGASATSELTDDSGTYAAAHAVDGDRNTAWCEGADGLGAGEVLTLTLKQRTDLARIEIDGGYFKDDRTLTNNGRPRTATLASDAGWSVEVSFPFVPLREHKAKKIPVKPVAIEAPGPATTLTLTLGEADAGRFTRDVCISEIALYAG